MSDLKSLVPETDYKEIKKITSDEGRHVLEISVQEDGIVMINPNITDDFVDLEVALRKGKRVGLFDE